MIRLYLLHFKERPEEAARRELQKDFVCYFEHILEAAPQKTASVRQFASHLINYPRRARHVGNCWRNKVKLISDFLLWTPTHGHISVGRPAKTYVHQFCTDTVCRLEDLSGSRADWDGLRERIKEVRAVGYTSDRKYLQHDQQTTKVKHW